MDIGFTGTQRGMSPHQFTNLIKLLNEMGDPCSDGFFHHGGCIGADTEAHDAAREAMWDITVYPSNIKNKQGLNFRTDKEEGWKVIIKKEKSPLVRNHDIVNAVDILIAAPFTNQEELRSGTWATIRYARKKGVPVIMLYNKEE